MKHALLAASLVLVAGSTAGCGGDGAPTEASNADFCGVFEDFYEKVGELGAEAESSDIVSALKETGEDLEEVGTPEDIPDDARAGFELTVETLAGLAEDASEADLEELEKDFTDEETEQSEAFDEYLDKTCEEPSEPAPEEPSS